MKKSLLLSLLIIPFFVQTLSSQSGKSYARNISKGLSAYKTTWSPEKIFINTDKVHYSQDETIWASVYLVDGITHTKSSNSNVVYVEVVDSDGNVMSKKKGFAEELICSMSFHIHRNIPDGVYTMRAFTKYMQNDLKSFDYEREIYIGDVDLPMELGLNEQKEAYQDESSNVELSFYPEGGQLVYGIMGELVIKALDSSGKPVEIKGEVVNNLGNVVTTFDTGKYGLAKCAFTPIAGNTYFARFNEGLVTWEQRIPDILKNGYTLSLENMGEYLVVKAETTVSEGLDGTTMVGHVRGDRFLWFQGDETHGSKYIVRVPTDEMQDGIAHITLFTNKGKPVCERLAYVQNQVNATKLSLAGTRQVSDGEWSLDFELTDKKGIPAKGNFSISVLETDAKDDKSAHLSNIENWLELYSDYDKSHQANEVLKEEDAIRRRNILDALMVTNSWKRFSWDDISKERPIDQYMEPEKGIFIKGRTESLDKNRKGVPSMVSLELLGGELYQAKKQTDKDGRFVFGPFNFNDNLSMVLKASSLSGRNELAKQKVVIVLEEEADFYFSKESEDLDEERYVAKRKKVKRENTIRVARYDSPSRETYDFETGKKITQLNEVVVTENKKTQKELIEEQLETITPYYNRPTSRVFADSLSQNGINTAMNILRFMPGVQVNQPAEGPPVIRIRWGATSILSSTEPLFLIDGVTVDLGAVANLPIAEILMVDVLSGTDAGVYGSRGTNGVIAVYTNRGSGFNYNGKGKSVGADGRRSPHILTMTKKGFDTSEPFKLEECDSPVMGKIPAPVAKTVLWEPDIEIFGKRHKTLTFCPDDLAQGNYLIRVVGLSEDGNPISEEFVLPQPEF
ncbi:TonB-dependent receptor [Flagellimonas meridianipacifica]|uniref:TonB-dependent receptor-like protein n=1 Tax=Flagellimonas meridianipacifica TaxID=1080225 RepID=A0A2T0MJP7_9FLAO|nr:TonB-dependent receptor plug domain-containing protein [Allomuricauda pacifica]PRX57802.1 TonB-dependent receptor-like protein [Allomuricauda pacifica]